MAGDISTTGRTDGGELLEGLLAENDGLPGIAGGLNVKLRPLLGEGCRSSVRLAAAAAAGRGRLCGRRMKAIEATAAARSERAGTGNGGEDDDGCRAGAIGSGSACGGARRGLSRAAGGAATPAATVSSSRACSAVATGRNVS